LKFLKSKIESQIKEFNIDDKKGGINLLIKNENANIQDHLEESFSFLDPNRDGLHSIGAQALSQVFKKKTPENITNDLIKDTESDVSRLSEIFKDGTRSWQKDVFDGYGS